MRKPYKKIKAVNKLAKMKRKLRIRKTVIGTAEVPRICAFKSNKHLSIQVIDDSAGKTLFSVSTYGKDASKDLKGNVAGAKALGVKLADKLAEKQKLASA